MLGLNIKITYNSGRKLWNTSNVDRKFVCINAARNQSIRTPKTYLTDLQAASLDNNMCLLVDERDNIVGTATKRECHRVGPNGKTPLHRAFSVLMFNSAGELLVQKRAAHYQATRVTYPNAFTNTCCSHPLLINGVPEDVTTAAIRRLNEELGIPERQLNREDFTFISRFIYEDPGDGMWGEYELDHVLILMRLPDYAPCAAHRYAPRAAAMLPSLPTHCSTRAINRDVPHLSFALPNPNEIDDVKYIPRNKINSFIETLNNVTPWFKLIHNHMLPYWWDNLHRVKEIAEPELIQSFVNQE